MPSLTLEHSTAPNHGGPKARPANSANTGIGNYGSNIGDANSVMARQRQMGCPVLEIANRAAPTHDAESNFHEFASAVTIF